MKQMTPAQTQSVRSTSCESLVDLHFPKVNIKPFKNIALRWSAGIEIHGWIYKHSAPPGANIGVLSSSLPFYCSGFNLKSLGTNSIDFMTPAIWVRISAGGT